MHYEFGAIFTLEMLTFIPLSGQKERLNPPGAPAELWLGHDQLELKALEEDADETGDTSIARSTPTVDYRSASSMDRSRNYIMPYSGQFGIVFCNTVYVLVTRLVDFHQLYIDLELPFPIK